MMTSKQVQVTLKGHHNDQMQMQQKENVSNVLKSAIPVQPDGLVKRRHLSVVDNNDQVKTVSDDREDKCGRKKRHKSKVNVKEQKESQYNEQREGTNKDFELKGETENASNVSEIVNVARTSTGVEVVSPTKLYFTIPKGVINIDLDDGLFEYGAEIVAHVKEREKAFILPEDFLELNSVTESMRSILVDWLIQVQHHLKFSQQCLYLTIAMLDNILNKRDIDPDKLQLVGSTSLWIASKVEEYYPAELAKLIDLTENSYKAHHIVQMEKIMLRILEFNVYLPEPSVFLLRLVRAAFRSNDSTFISTCHYLIDSFLTHVEFSATAPSLVAAGAVLAALHLFSGLVVEDTGSKLDCWTDTLVYYSGYSSGEVAPIALAMLEEVLRAATVEDYKYRGAYTKYKSNSQHGKLVLQAHLAPKVIQNALHFLSGSDL